MPKLVTNSVALGQIRLCNVICEINISLPSLFFSACLYFPFLLETRETSKQQPIKHHQYQTSTDLKNVFKHYFMFVFALHT